MIFRTVSRDQMAREALREKRGALPRHSPPTTGSHPDAKTRDFALKPTVITATRLLLKTDMLGKTDYDILELRDADKLTAIKRKYWKQVRPFHLESSLGIHMGARVFRGAYVPKLGPNRQTDGVSGISAISPSINGSRSDIRAKEEWERTSTRFRT